MKFYLSLFILFLHSSLVYSQYADEYNSGMVIKMNPEGTKQTRVILWGQTWFQDFEGHNKNDGFSIKRARVLMYSQLNDRFLILTHFGVNGVSANNMSATGKSDDVQLFLQEMSLQFKVNKYLYIGGGLHYWDGISRLNGQATINMLTLDNNRSSWTTLGLSNQMTSHLGIYAKGDIGKINYRFNISDAITKTLDGNGETIMLPNQEKYLGKALLDKGKYSFSGYVDYQFFDKENLTLPYRVGTYLGAKKIFNLGTGFFIQNSAIVQTNSEGYLSSANVRHLNIDAFYDAPLGNKNAAITAYAQFQNSKMGNNYVYSDIIGNGNQFYGHIGYLIAKKIDEGKHKYSNRWQPYIAYSNRNFTALVKPAEEIKFGCNFYIDGLNARLTAEYQKSFHLESDNNDVFTFQAMIIL
jgi:hypothetical protein